MRQAFSLLSNQPPPPEQLPSGSARTSLLSAVARHEDRLQALHQQAEGALRRGEVEANELLETALLALDSGLAAAARALAVEMDDLAASCEDGLAGATLDADGPALEDMVAGARQQLRALPTTLGASASACVDAALQAACEADAAAERAVGDSASSIVCGCGVAEAAIASELAHAKTQLMGEVRRTARAHAAALPQALGSSSSSRRHSAQDGRWGEMFARMDDLCNASLQRCVHGARTLGDWSGEALLSPCASLEALLRDLLKRVRMLWNAEAMRIGRTLRGGAMRLQELFAEGEERTRAHAAARAAALAASAAAASSSNSSPSSSSSSSSSRGLPAISEEDESAGASASASASASQRAERLRSAQATLAALLYAASKQIVGSLCRGLEALLTGLQAIVKTLSSKRKAAAAAAAATSAILDEGSSDMARYIAAAAEGVASLQRTTRDAHHWQQGEVYDEVESLLLAMVPALPADGAPSDRADGQMSNGFADSYDDGGGGEEHQMTARPDSKLTHNSRRPLPKGVEGANGKHRGGHGRGSSSSSNGDTNASSSTATSSNSSCSSSSSSSSSVAGGGGGGGENGSNGAAGSEHAARDDEGLRQLEERAAAAEAAVAAAAAKIEAARAEAERAAAAASAERSARAAAEEEAMTLRTRVSDQSQALGSMSAQLRGLREAMASTQASDSSAAPAADTMPEWLKQAEEEVARPQAASAPQLSPATPLGGQSPNAAQSLNAAQSPNAVQVPNAVQAPSGKAAVGRGTQMKQRVLEANAMGGSRGKTASGAVASSRQGVANDANDATGPRERRPDEPRRKPAPSARAEDDDDEEEEGSGGGRWIAKEGRWSDGDGEEDDEDDEDEDEDDESDEEDEDDEEDEVSSSEVSVGDDAPPTPTPPSAGDAVRLGRLSDGSTGSSTTTSSTPPAFVWRPVVPRGSAGAAAARLRAAQQEQREKLLARLFPGESTLDQSSGLSTPVYSSRLSTPSRTTPAQSVTTSSLPSLESTPAFGHEDLRDIDGDEPPDDLEDDNGVDQLYFDGDMDDGDEQERK